MAGARAGAPKDRHAFQRRRGHRQEPLGAATGSRGRSPNDMDRQGVFAFVDVLRGGAALVVEPHHPVRHHRQVGDDEAITREQFARMPFDFRDYPALLDPGRRLIPEALVEAFDLGQRRPTHGAAQSMCDLLA